MTVSEIFTLESNLPWLDQIPSRIQSVYLGKFLHFGVFNELHKTHSKKWFKRKSESTEPVGVWGWNTWCGVHCLPLLTRGEFGKILTHTFDVGFNRLEPGTGLLPHAIVHRNGVFSSESTYKCYEGKHGESYNLDNILCWAKMAMEYFLITNDLTWFTPDIFSKITHTIDYILTHFCAKFNPTLIEAGIEGDWTECTNWELDNANVTVNMLNTLQLIIECQSLLGTVSTSFDYSNIYREMKDAFNLPLLQGGFWSPELGYLIHGNDGTGRIIHGDRYFESTVNYFALLWDLISGQNRSLLWQYLDKHHQKIEKPYPVLTNYLPRTGARRIPYGHTVTNGDIWMVLGAHATAARLQAGYQEIGTEMYQSIVNYELQHGTLHNCLYQNGTANNEWSPEIANYGALYAPFVLGVLGLRPLAHGLEFHIRPLAQLNRLRCNLFCFGIPVRFDIRWNNGQFEQILISPLSSDHQEFKKTNISQPDFLIHRSDLSVTY